MSLRFVLCSTLLWSYISTILNCIVMNNLCFAVGRILRWPPNDPHPYIIPQPLSEEDTCVYIWWTITFLISMFYGTADWRKKLSQIGLIWCFLGSSVIKNLSACAGDPGSIPGSRRSPGEGNATHFGILAWEIPWTEEPDGLQSIGSHKSQTQLSDWTTTTGLI